jgi:hypothetical protein
MIDEIPSLPKKKSAKISLPQVVGEAILDGENILLVNEKFGSTWNLNCSSKLN